MLTPIPDFGPPKKPTGKTSPDRLESWKEIAAYLNRTLRTVQRWEKSEGLPVHRHQHEERASVWAFKGEVDAWWNTRRMQLEQETKQPEIEDEQIRGEERQGPLLEEVINKAQEKDRKLRYQNAVDIRTDRPWPKGDSDSSRVAAATEQIESRAIKSTTFRWMAAVAIAIVVVIGLAVGRWMFFSPKAHALTDRDTIVLADFTNTTGDSVFDDMLRQGLAVQLEQSPFLSPISDKTIHDTLRLMGQPSGAKLTPEVAKEVCQRTGSAAVLDGSIASLGREYVLGLDAANCRTGEFLAREQEQAERKEDVLKALDKAATRVREKLGESLSTVQKFDKPSEEITTTSFEALKDFSLWKKNLNEKGDDAAIPFIKRAIELDPDFALAYSALGTSYLNLRETNLATENFKRAYELRDRLSESEKLLMSIGYYLAVTGELDKANQSSQLLAQEYPRLATPHTDLGNGYAYLGQYEKSVPEYLEALRLQPDNPVFSANLAFGYMSLNRLDEAKATLQRAMARSPDTPYLHVNFYWNALLRNDSPEMNRQATWAVGKPGVEDKLLSYEGDTAAYSGQLKKAREFWRQAVASAEGAQETETAATYEAEAAQYEALFGNPARARQQAASALALSNGRDVQYGAALASGLIEDSTREQVLADNLGQRFPRDTIVQFNYLPTLRAELALSRNDTSKAIEVLQAAGPYELGSVGFAVYPVYVRGEAYLAAHQSVEAAAEFQKILDHRGIVLNEPIGAIAHLQIGRAYAMQGDTAKAKAAYQDFLTLWKDADPDIPVLKQAKAEYAKLQ